MEDITSKSMDALVTPAAIVDLVRMDANITRMSEYAQGSGVALRPHTKTHKSARLARLQLAAGAHGVTVATVREAEVMAAVADDILLAYPPIGAAKLDRLFALPRHVNLGVALDSPEALETLAAAARASDRTVGVLVEVDLGMRRVGLGSATDVVRLARIAAATEGIDYRGVLFYPGHIREDVAEQGPALERLARDMERLLEALSTSEVPARTVSGGSTPTAFGTHILPGITEIRPGTYIFNDRTTAAIGACAWDDCAYSVLATVVSTAVAGQAVIDAGAKALAREELRGATGDGYGALLDRPEVVVRALSEEHGILDLSATRWRPRIGDRVQVVPNHVCVSVNLHDRVFAARGSEIVDWWPVDARGWQSSLPT